MKKISLLTLGAALIAVPVFAAPTGGSKADADGNGTLTRAMREHVPPLVRNKRFKLYYATQAGVDPPTFILFVNDPALVHFSYKRYLERALRESYDFDGTAIKLVFRGRTEENPAP